jgi:hypothetical protein
MRFLNLEYQLFDTSTSIPSIKPADHTPMTSTQSKKTSVVMTCDNTNFAFQAWKDKFVHAACD